MDIKEEQRLQDMLINENELRQKGYNHICGIDEAGRGPLCGPVVASAVILDKNMIIEGVNDSKKLTEKKREELYEKIMSNALSVGIGMADINEIEELKTLVSGDSKSLSIACASIIAKVTRDRLLRDMDEKYPEYGFAKHKGYGTKAHIEAIKKYGITDIHRPSFCKKFI